MFCSFFDLSGNPPRISATESMSPALNSGRLILLDLICRSAARILVGSVHEAEVGAAHRVAFEARGCHPDHGRKWESSTLAQRQKSRLVDATRRWASWTPIAAGLRAAQYWAVRIIALTGINFLSSSSRNRP
jgi:hypothetical protein